MSKKNYNASFDKLSREKLTKGSESKRQAAQNVIKCMLDLPSVDFNNLQKRLDSALSGIFSRTFAFANLFDFLLGQVESNLSAMLRKQRALLNCGNILTVTSNDSIEVAGVQP